MVWRLVKKGALVQVEAGMNAGTVFSLAVGSALANEWRVRTSESMRNSLALVNWMCYEPSHGNSLACVMNHR